MSITIADDINRAPFFEEAFKEIERIQAIFNPNDSSSDISRVNTFAFSRPVALSDEFLDIVSIASEISEKTFGSFDMTFASLGRLWDFNEENFVPPSHEQIKELLKFVSYKNVIVDKKAKTVSLAKYGTKIGLGGIVKGYASKKAIEVLKSKGVKNCLVACAGDIHVAGTNNGRPWLVGIKDPRGESVIATFYMTDGDSVSTSGDYERYKIYKGKRYHHIIDPRTGYPADSGLISVTVFSKDPILTDAYSTAFFVMGLEKALAILKRDLSISAALITSDMKVYVSSSLRDKIHFREDLKIVYF
ncbi:MAG: Thiamine biosynthesis lipoprotein ApbE precursor [Spirochaetes bacterium ADurb.Bin218]|nr:MAG: Thiamine biosynthesis lipoprotein ApbE precursor [Spirochaetes bacterium ADurb.Bin218]